MTVSSGPLAPAARLPAVPSPDDPPVRAVVASVLGLFSAVLGALAGSFLALLFAVSDQGLAVLFAVVTLALVAGHLAGALLVLCRRSVRLLVLTAVPMAAVGGLALHAAVSGSGPTATSVLTAVPIGMGACAAGAAVLAGSSPVRTWIATRPGRRAPLHEEARWL